MVRLRTSTAGTSSLLSRSVACRAVFESRVKFWVEGLGYRIKGRWVWEVATGAICVGV